MANQPAADIAGALALFRKLETITGEGVGSMIRARSGMLARYLAESTQPMGQRTVEPDGEITITAMTPMPVGRPVGNGRALQKMGQGAVVRDLSKVFLTPDKAYALLKAESGPRIAAGFWRLFKANKMDKAFAYLRKHMSKFPPVSYGAFSEGAHQSARRSRGRVTGSQNKMLLTAGTGTFYGYREKIKARVGLAKSGWIAAARRVRGAEGFTRVAGWMSQPSAPGGANDQSMNTTRPSVTLTNRIRYADVAIRSEYVDAAALRASRALAKDIKFRIKYLMEKQGVNRHV